MFKYFMFSDTHGCYDALISSLEAAGFDEDNTEHILIGAGDYFDRGSQNAQIYKFLSSEKLKDRVHLIFGNHDQMLKEFLSGQSDGVFNATYNGLNKTIGNFAQVDCNPTMLQYDGDFYIGKIKQNYPHLIKFLNSMVNVIKIDKYYITHAGMTHVNKYVSWDTPIWEVDNWAKTPEFIDKFKAVGNYIFEDKIFVMGHWHAKRLRAAFGLPESNETFVYKNFIGLDACSNISGFVNIFVYESESLPTYE